MDFKMSRGPLIVQWTFVLYENLTKEREREGNSERAIQRNKEYFNNRQ